VRGPSLGLDACTKMCPAQPATATRQARTLSRCCRDGLPILEGGPVACIWCSGSPAHTAFVMPGWVAEQRLLCPRSALAGWLSHKCLAKPCHARGHPYLHRAGHLHTAAPHAQMVAHALLGASHVAGCAAELHAVGESRGSGRTQHTGGSMAGARCGQESAGAAAGSDEWHHHGQTPSPGALHPATSSTHGHKR